MSAISIETKKVTELKLITDLADDDLFPVHNNAGLKTTTLETLRLAMVANNAGAHNAIYRGKALGSALTDEQSAAIKAGTFEDLYIGDYWTIGGVNYRIAAFDYYLNSGDTNCTTHHVVIVPDTCLYNAQMNTSDTTSGGYVGSAMYKSNLESAKTTIKSAFSGHVLSKRCYFTNAITSSGAPSGGSWYDSEVDLMSERMVYGNPVFSTMGNGSSDPWGNMHLYTCEKSQLPLFQHEPSCITNRSTYWLRDIVTAADFALVNGTGDASNNSASNSYGVRPAFAIS